jgi:hypothetical protein
MGPRSSVKESAMSFKPWNFVVDLPLDEVNPQIAAAHARRKLAALEELKWAVVRKVRMDLDSGRWRSVAGFLDFLNAMGLDIQPRVARRAIESPSKKDTRFKTTPENICSIAAVLGIPFDVILHQASAFQDKRRSVLEVCLPHFRGQLLHAEGDSPPLQDDREDAGLSAVERCVNHLGVPEKTFYVDNARFNDFVHDQPSLIDRANAPTRLYGAIYCAFRTRLPTFAWHLKCKAHTHGADGRRLIERIEFYEDVLTNIYVTQRRRGKGGATPAEVREETAVRLSKRFGPTLTAGTLDDLLTNAGVRIKDIEDGKVGPCSFLWIDSEMRQLAHHVVTQAVAA